MVFKLIKLDTDTPSKITLRVGKHIIGRGKFLHNDDTDKRVSRNHAELEVTDDSISIKSLHINPCFYSRKDTTNIEILEKSNTVLLNNGDKFGLIPDYFWYEVVNCSDLDNTNKKQVEECNKESEINGIDEARKEDLIKEEDAESLEQDNNQEATINFDMDEGEDLNRSASPSLLTTEVASPDDNVNRAKTEPDSPGLLPGPSNDEESTESYEVNAQTSADSVLSTPSKRNHDAEVSSPEGVKRVKTEPQSPDVRPGPSNDQAAPNVKDQKPNIAMPNSVKPSPPRRERCMYGANCYRRNPQHKAQFSHPSDSDWGTGNRGVCPYGHLCRKADPRHWQQNEHPPGVNAPSPNAGRPGRNRQKRIKRAKSSESEDSEDSPQTDLVVTGKRARKTVKRDVWDDTQSDENEDPYKTDESDEWQPPSDVTNSDFSQNF